MSGRSWRLGGGALLACILLAAGHCPKPPKPGDPIAGLTAAQRDMFERGRAVFDSVFAPETGLGPLFNSTGCGECHEDPVSGGAGDEIERHASRLLGTGFCDPLADSGGPVFQLHVTPALKAALGIDSEPVPAGADQARRTTPHILGFGLLDAVPDSTLVALAAAEAARGDGVAGRVSRDYSGRIGRFGRKALTATLLEFTEGAFPTESGVTDSAAPSEGTVAGQPIPPGVDPLPEPELDAEHVRLADAFVRFLAPPAPLRLSSTGRHGREIFAKIGCAECHVPALRTGADPVAALAYKNVNAYTDLLLHDMGSDLADMCLGLVATRSDFRTAPLMGLRLAKHFLHDGRAQTIEDAIVAHGGEGAASRTAFQGLSDQDRQALLEFLRSL